MQKTWRASDVLIILLLAVLCVLTYLQINQADRNFDRLKDVISALPAAGTAAGPNTAPPAGIPAEQPVKPAVNQAKLGDWLVREFGVEPGTLNPLTSEDVYSQIVHGYLFDSMIDRDPDTLAWRAKMAESWAVSPDHLTYTFKLRDGLLWSDGEPITADDVVFSFQTMMDPLVDASRSAGYYKDIESVKALDKLHVQFKYKQPYFLAFEVCGTVMVIPRHVYKYDDAKKFNAMRDVLVGSGPYVFEAWKPAQEIVIKRNDRYWGPPGHFDKIVFKIVLDETVGYQRCRAQELDRLSLSPEQYERMGKDEKFLANYKRLLYPALGSGYSYIGWNERSELFQDKRVRQALTMLVPRERIRKEILHDLADVASGPFYPAQEGIKVPLQADPTVKPWPFDPQRALALLHDAGWRDPDGSGLLKKDGRPFKFKLTIPQNNPTGLDIVNVAREEMAKVGIAVEVVELEWSVFVGKLKTREYEAVLLGWGGAIEDDPYQIWHSDSIANAGSNHIGFKNAEADRLIMAARVEFDPVKRNELYHAFHRLLHEEQPYTFLFVRKSTAAVHKRFEDVRIHPIGLYDEEWWVPAGKRLYTK